MNNKAFIVLVLLLNLLQPLLVLGQQRTIELKDNFFYIDGEKTFLKGVSYEIGAIPGQYPWEGNTDAELIEFEVNRILSAGFNTLRMWGTTTKEDLDVLMDFNINIMLSIWIGEGDDYSDPDFVDRAKNLVSSVLSYSKNYDNIICYFIHNEPLPEHIFSSGYAETQYLWQALAEIIHSEHPGRPVSMSNTCVGNYIDPAFFDFSAYNVYPYNPATVNHSHGYAAFIEYLKQMQNDNKPLIITEFGLPVSPSGPGNWGYGGNTLQEQTDAIRYMYSALLDGGAGGCSIFSYSDGWWKAGDPATHDDNPEEWFGMVNYTGLTDKYGEVRPVWDAVKNYQNAIITSPRNSAIYSNQLVVEIFSEDFVDSVKMFDGLEIIYKNAIQNNYLVDTIEFVETGINDQKLHFEFYDDNSLLVKEEDINCLIAAEDIELPHIEITTDPENFSGPGDMSVTFKVINNPVFSNTGKLQYVYYPHQGWEYGDTLSIAMSFTDNQFEFYKDFSISDLPYVVSFAAGFDITYGNFTKRIHADKTLIRDDLKVLDENKSFNKCGLTIYPNPTGEDFHFNGTSLSENHLYFFKIVDLQGRLLLSGQSEVNQPIYIHQLEKGNYIIIIENENHQSFYQRFIKI